MQLVCEHHEGIELDLLPDHDLLDFWRGTMSPRRLHLLIHDIGPDSHLGRAMNPDAAFLSAWSATDYILADLFDLTYAATGAASRQPYLRPADLLERRDQLRQRDEFLAAQAERNRIRDAKEARSG